ncbi:hypothetical protein LAG90_13895 [Marinilongibacter aquaticus]|uniref:hypothetical protein n=1 Tax=Marinilongibacter aquaticus TaxID=2975157 RepID=UPI0021BDB2A9|nr:hypothetical protein [Marinilongibacter aquaticus]UBM57898.1 hypothetical protein LAG90_13895 [Marinilongibacter aquaticus]
MKIPFLNSKAILAGLSVFFILSSCSKDKNDDTTPVTDNISFDGKEFDLNSRFFLDFGFDGDESNVEFFVSSLSEDELSSTSTVCDDCEHILIDMDMYSPSETFETGVFKVNGEIGEHSAFGQVVIGTPPFEDEEAVDVFDFESGTVTISGSTPNYTIELDVVTTGGQKLQATYSGEFIDFTPQLSSVPAPNLRKR